MDDLREINEALRTYPQSIYEASIKTEDLREAWALLEAKLAYEEATALLVVKATGEKVTEATVKAKVTEEVYDRAMEVIRAESSYRRALADQCRLDNEFVAVRKRAGLIEAQIQRMGQAA
jgi:hypothetical protein